MPETIEQKIKDGFPELRNQQHLYRSKTQATGYFNAKKMPMKSHENILVFYDKTPKFNPQKTEGHKPVNTYTKKAEVCNKTEVYGKVKKDVSGGGETDRYPRSVQVFASDKQKTKLDGTIHPKVNWNREGKTILRYSCSESFAVLPLTVSRFVQWRIKNY